MKYNIGDIVICHFDEDSRLVPKSYYDKYQDRIGEIIEVCNQDKPHIETSYILDISEPGDYFFEDEFSPFGGIDSIEFDDVLELIN